MESQLRQWKPRPPSPDLERRIFARPTLRERLAVFNGAEVTRWLVPAMGCFLLMLATLTPRQPASPAYPMAETNGGMLAAVSSSNGVPVSRAAYAVADYQSELNNIPSRLRLTFGSAGLSLPPAAFLATNSLIR